MRDLLLYPTPLQQDGAVKDVELQPFKLIEQPINQPIEFEVTLIKDGIRYQYGFAVTEYQFVKEHLIVYRANKAQRWFVRHFNPATRKDVYKFSEPLWDKRICGKTQRRSIRFFCLKSSGMVTN